MVNVSDNSLLDLLLKISWASRDGEHEENYFAGKVNMWRDVLPAKLCTGLMGKTDSDGATARFKAGELVPPYDAASVKTLPLAQFRVRSFRGYSPEPAAGRFFPGGLISGVSGLYPESIMPVRILERDEKNFTVDWNHPLAMFGLTVKATVKNLRDQKVERGGRCSAWLEDALSNGPGMQVRWQERATDFGVEPPLERQNEESDGFFYRQSRLVGHIDTTASGHLRDVYQSILPPEGRILDLMASYESHFEAGKRVVTGLGLNAEEMRHNKLLASHLVHDLNSNPAIPLKEASFDAVVCSLSIEYLVDPVTVLRNAGRLLVRGGTMLIGFSNRWFPAKVTSLWTRLHEFERLGLVMELLRQAGCLAELKTFSFRNWPRPEEDKHFPELVLSDPVYVVAARKI